jgi:L-aspartate oxidase
VLSHHVAIDLITQPSDQEAGATTCVGAYVLDLQTRKIAEYTSHFTVLATGGVGQLYRTTTNPVIATGDGIAMAHRAGARVSNMEFVQFHPTAFYDEHSSPAFLISEAVRGQGAYLRNSAGERFMFRYHIDGELACRDVVSRAIASEISEGNEPYVYLDCTHLPAETVSRHFPNIYKTCLSRGVDLSHDYIPVAPAAHYLCGGIDVDLRSRTNIHNLYACGECSNTGLHGANRLASNSLLEATVFAHNCFEDISSLINVPVADVPFRSVHDGHPDEDNLSAILETRIGLQNLMSRYAGIVRSDKGLKHAIEQLTELERVVDSADGRKVHDPSWYELRNLLACARLILEQSLLRKENKGGFFNKNLEIDQVLS